MARKNETKNCDIGQQGYVYKKLSNTIWNKNLDWKSSIELKENFLYSRCDVLGEVVTCH